MFSYEGKEYLLDSSSGDVYDIQTQDEVGKMVQRLHLINNFTDKIEI